MSDAIPKIKPPPPRTSSSNFAALKNVSGFRELVARVTDRAPSLPNIGVMHGRSGDGKTYASIYAQNKTRAIRVEVGDTWTRKTLLTAILREGGVARPQGSIPELAEQAIAMLAEEPRRPLFIDEADKVVDKGYAELMREIAMSSNVPVLLIGEEALPQKLASIERLHNRVLAWFGAEPCDLEDARKLADLLLPVAISDDLLEEIRIQGDGRARRIATSLDGVSQWARNAGAKEVTRANYAGPIYTGEPPKARASRLIVARSAKSGRAA
ncbi:ATP-binding protein [Methylocystis sp. H4A]|uniref:AAA family ATPase n=1 Tax=Methylocystis sp. H4A TaxID=2785788 RepID=UPI0018C2E689|nr:ATP-binding protein [Methylocystis sp. H4A]MBG0802866.1 ATP-binding protein [Methylocystis sp. H4A]